MTEIISPHSINLDFLEKIFRNKLEIVVDPELETNVAKSYEIVQKSAEGDLPVYGVNTGFGKLANKIIPSEDREQLQKNLVLSHCAGIGEPLPEDVTRLMMVLKIVSLSLGASGVKWSTIKQIERIINSGIVPEIPHQGSVGAQAVENWVPFKRARPSFGPRVIGSIPAFFSASKLESFSPL